MEEHMTKLSKTVLKGIVKECLIEILSEGIGSDSKKTITEHSMSKKRKKQKQSSSSRNYLDKISYQKRKPKKVTTNITNDPILNEILADTASSTLQEQLSAEGRKNTSVMVGGDAAAKIVNNTSPEELFGENASKWAALAFDK